MIDKRVYVGKTKTSLHRRLKKHIYGAKRYKIKLDKNKKGRNYNYNWINSLAERGIEPEGIILEEFRNINLYDLNLAEKWYIMSFKKLGMPMTNTASGGDGGHGIGYIPNKETRAKISNSLKQFFVNNEAPNKGRKLTQEQKDHLAKINTGKKHTRESLEKMSLAHTGEKNYFYGKHHTDESKAKLAIGHSKLTSKQVEEIKWLFVEGKLTTKAIGEKYSVRTNVITSIKNGKRWSIIKIYDSNGNEIRVQDLKRIHLGSLTQEDVVAIKKHLAEGKLTQRQIAKLFHVRAMTISKIKCGKNYGHIT